MRHAVGLQEGTGVRLGISDARHLVGRITGDPVRAGEVPLLVIDGKPFNWNQVGRMLMSFEGFTLRAFVSDSIEAVGGPFLQEEAA
jgi:hypothetical protein